MHHWGGQPTVTKVMQGSAGENLSIIDEGVDMMNEDSGKEDLVNIS